VLHTIYAPTEKIAGSAGAVRITRKDVDILFVTFYFPPDYCNPASRVAVREVIEWVSSVVLKMPNRVVVVFSGDINGGVGYDDNANDHYPHVGSCQPDAETYNGK